MSTTNQERAKNLAGLFGKPAARANEVSDEPSADPTPNAPVARQSAKSSSRPPVRESRGGNARPVSPKAAAPLVEESHAIAAAVGVMGKVITIAATDADPGSVVGEAADNPTAVDVHPIDLSPRPVEPATPESSADLVTAKVIELLCTPTRLSGTSERHNVQVPQATLDLLREVDKRLAQSGRPVVSRNALLAAAAERIITDPARFEHMQAPVARTGSAGVQGRISPNLRVRLRAAVYSTDTPLVTAHAMAHAVNELLAAAKRGLRLSSRS